MSTVTIARNFYVGATLTDMTSVTLSDAATSYGVKRDDTGVAVVPDDTAMSHDGTGIYSYTFTEPAADLTYTASIEYVYSGVTYWFTISFSGAATPAAVDAVLITVDDLIDYLRIDRRDLETDAFEIWQEDSGATAATVKVTKTQLILSKIGGTNAGDDTLTLTDYSTLGALITAIEDLNRSWTCLRLCSASITPPNIYYMDTTSALGYDSRITVTHTDEDWLQLLVNSAQSFMETYCHRAFESGDYVEYYSGDGTKVLMLRKYPVSTLTSIYRVTGYTDDVESTTEIDSDYYRLDAQAGIVWHDTKWLEGTRNYKVTYSAGYATIPYDLKTLCLEIAAKLYHSGGRDPMLKQERLGPYTRQYLESALSPDILERLSLYRRWAPVID